MTPSALFAALESSVGFNAERLCCALHPTAPVKLIYQRGGRLRAYCLGRYCGELVFSLDLEPEQKETNMEDPSAPATVPETLPPDKEEAEELLARGATVGWLMGCPFNRGCGLGNIYMAFLGNAHARLVSDHARRARTMNQEALEQLIVAGAEALTAKAERSKKRKAAKAKRAPKKPTKKARARGRKGK